MTTSLFADLPEFEERYPVGTSLALSGAVDRRTRPFRIGDSIALVVECKVTGVEHKETKGGIVRVHKLAVGDAYELGGERRADLLEVLHEEYVQYEDELAARRPIPFDDDDPYGADAAAGAGAEARADRMADLAEIEAWANHGDTLEVYESSDAALAALEEYAAAVRVMEEGDGWGDFDPAGQSDHDQLAALRAWAQDMVASGAAESEDAALVALAEALAGDVDQPEE